MAWTCERLQRNLVELEEGDASLVERAFARLHLAVCLNCRRYASQIGEVRRALSVMRPPDLSPDEVASVIARIHEDEPGT